MKFFEGFNSSKVQFERLVGLLNLFTDARFQFQ